MQFTLGVCIHTADIKHIQWLLVTGHWGFWLVPLLAEGVARLSKCLARGSCAPLHCFWIYSAFQMIFSLFLYQRVAQLVGSFSRLWQTDADICLINLALSFSLCSSSQCPGDKTKLVLCKTLDSLWALGLSMSLSSGLFTKKSLWKVFSVEQGSFKIAHGENVTWAVCRLSAPDS